MENNGGAFQALSPGWKRRAGNLKHSGSPARFCMYWGEKTGLQKGFYFLLLWHGLDSSLFGGNQICRGIGKAQHFP